MGHVLMENRLVVDGDLTAVECWPNARAHSGLRSVAKLYDTKGFVAELRQLRATPHVRMTPTDARHRCTHYPTYRRSH